MKQAVEFVCDGGHEYEHVGFSATAQVLGGTGSIGDYLSRVVVTVTTSATSAVLILDGGVLTHTLVPANTPIGVYSIVIGARSVAGPWKITTGAGVEVMAVGQFSI